MTTSTTMLLNLRRPPYRTYSITQLCREFGATPRALRFYEEQGLLSPARRDLSRVYSYKDRARLQMILTAAESVCRSPRSATSSTSTTRKARRPQSAEALRIFRHRIEQLEHQRVEVEEGDHPAEGRLGTPGEGVSGGRRQAGTP
jgi:DNA-binding transcriptional MerR regulator